MDTYNMMDMGHTIYTHNNEDRMDNRDMDNRDMDNIDANNGDFEDTFFLYILYKFINKYK